MKFFIGLKKHLKMYIIEVNREKTSNFQNFDSIAHVNPGTEDHYGGSVALADYCPYNQEFTWRANNSIVRGSHCLYEDNDPRKQIEKY